MSEASNPLKVNIRPGVSMLSVLSRMEYRPWFALAEFVDNAVQSFANHMDAIRALDGEAARVVVSIDLDPGTQSIIVSDNAAGIALEEFPRAFRPAEIPPDRSGLSEFGMGMKSAACWFSPRWSVRTSALGDPVERTVSFDIVSIVEGQVEEIEVDETEAPADAHYTVVRLDAVSAMPKGKTVGKIKEHLTDIYRAFIRDERLELRYRNEVLEYEEPAVLEAPRYDANNEPSGPDVVWSKPIDFDFGAGLSARGFAALRATGSTSHAGFSLFRRGRVIEGSGDEKYRPAYVFGRPNSYESQRVFGELHLEGFDVSHTKDGFRWDENEEPFLQFLKVHLDSDELPLLRQARNYRERAAKASRQNVASDVLETTADVLTKHGPKTLPDAAAVPTDDPPVPGDLFESEHIARRSFEIHADGVRWIVNLELSSDPAVKDWMSIAEHADDGQRTVGVRIGLESAFMRRIVRYDEPAVLEPVVRVAAGMALAEHLARAGGATQAGNVRRRLNELLAGALSKRE